MQPQLKLLEWDKASDLVKKADEIIIIGHARPDGDAIGSITSLGLSLGELGKTVTMAVEGDMPDYLKFIPGAERVRNDLRNAAADLVICVDSSDIKVMGRMGQQAMALNAPVLMIDHHIAADLFGQARLVWSEAVSTTEIIFDWLERLHVPISPSIAECLLVGFIADTQNFEVGPVTADTFQKVSKLVALGANFQKLRNLTLDNDTPLDVLYLFGRALHRTKMEGGVIWAVLETADFHEVGVKAEGTVGAVDIILTTHDVKIAAEFAATDAGHVRVSLRAMEGYNVGRIAAEFGGGGHAKAAGGTFENTTTVEAVAYLLPKLKAEAGK